MPAALSRRAVLAGALAAAGVAACTSSGSTPAPSTSTPPTPEQLTRMAAVAREQELGRLAKVALDAYPAMTGAKSTVAFTAQHVQALSETLVPSPSVTTSGTGSVSQSHSSGNSQNEVNRGAAARSLATALLDAAAAHRAAATSSPGDLARLLVSVAASDSALAAVLQRKTS